MWLLTPDAHARALPSGAKGQDEIHVNMHEFGSIIISRI